jgi:FkbM family methyltransferase
MSGFYSNAIQVGISLVANIGRFNGWRSRWTFLYSSVRHFLFLVCKIPLTPRILTLRFSNLEIRFKEFTGELGNIKTVFFDEDDRIPLPNKAVALDVGANIGLFSLCLVWKHGRERFNAIHLFEPNPDVFSRLQYNLKANGLDGLCHAHPIALSDGDGEVYMEAPRGYSVLGMISDKGTVPVRRETLDAWSERNGVSSADLLKVDVEGHEMELWRGAPGFIARTARIYIEVKGQHLQTLLDEARGAGFSETSRQTLGTGDAMLLLERAARA